MAFGAHRRRRPGARTAPTWPPWPAPGRPFTGGKIVERLGLACGSAAGLGFRGGPEDDQPLPPASPQLVDRVQVQAVGQPVAALPAGGQDHLVVVVGTGFGAHRRDQVLVAIMPLAR